jgi:hypothetical protein
MMLKSREVRIPGITGADTEVFAAYFEAATFLTYCSNIPFSLYGLSISSICSIEYRPLLVDMSLIMRKKVESTLAL